MSNVENVEEGNEELLSTINENIVDLPKGDFAMHLRYKSRAIAPCILDSVEGELQKYIENYQNWCGLDQETKMFEKNKADPDPRMSRNVQKCVPNENLDSQTEHIRVLRRGVGNHQLAYFDPFVLMVEYKGVTSPPKNGIGHPHRGVQTITYMLSGAMKHKDFLGHEMIIEAGDIQIMNAGKGMIHCEIPDEKKPPHAIVFWVNLPSSQKMSEPSYQEMKSKDIPRASKDGVHVNVIVGTSMGVQSKLQTKVPSMFLHFTMEPETSMCQSIQAGWNAFIYVLWGDIHIGEAPYVLQCVAGNTLVLADGDKVDIQNKTDDTCDFLIIAAEPIKEPIIQRGPFVMNTHQEIKQAMSDFKNGENGFEKMKEWNK